MPITLQRVDIGTVPGDKTGTPGRSAFDIANDNAGVVEAAMEDAELKAFVVKCVAKGVTIGVEEAVEWWRQPYAFVVTGARAAVFEAQSGEDIVLDILEDGVSILDSNGLVIPAGSDTSVGHSPAPMIDHVILLDNSLMTIDVVSTGSGATAKGLEVTLLGYVIWVTD